MLTAIKSITVVPDLGSTPARVNRYTGAAYVNGRTWPDIPKESKLFILLHEAGHATKNTRDEIEADSFAFDAYARLGYPLSKSIQALTRVLNFSNPEHFDRVAAQLRRACMYDKLHNNQPIDLQEVERVIQDVLYQNGFSGNENFFLTKLLIPKKVRQNIEAKMDASKAKSEASKAEAQARTAAANNPAAPSPGGTAAPGQPASGSTVPDLVAPGSAKKPFYKNPMILGAIAAVVVVVIIAVVMLKKKK